MSSYKQILKQIANMEQRLCIDDPCEILDDILKIAKGPFLLEKEKTKAGNRIRSQRFRERPGNLRSSKGKTMRYKNDFTKFIKENIESMADDHIETWRDRYWRKSKNEVDFDLNVNYDWSCDIEYIEQELGRKLEYDEIERFAKVFRKKVIKLLYNKKD